MHWGPVEDVVDVQLLSTAFGLDSLPAYHAPSHFPPTHHGPRGANDGSIQDDE